MKRTLSAILPLMMASLLSVSPAFAETHQHVAIVYCGIDKNHDVKVVAADVDLMGGATSAGKRWRSCSQVLHEVTLKGYRITESHPITYGPMTSIFSGTAEEISEQKRKYTIMKGKQTGESDEWGYVYFVLTKEEAAH